MYSTCYSCHTLIKTEFLNRFLKNIQISGFTNICPVGAELFHLDGQTGGWTHRYDKANSHFLQFCKTRVKVTMINDVES